ncbi:hypothetical protein IQ241_22385 [Romeria aff. gracilis LEGE 07310]|uniref:Uncharacterized protein n=1 Tax=Vasconcelosia minhoensis LEGE 07310 TaxID=915328 RepID=A0A8J7AVP3_9CYAN|nr:hypothetical protein [Romeria gracilis]MBE9080004.1 hypothetical protein [Romeria aff. gracilis LEGE 07310]
MNPIHRFDWDTAFRARHDHAQKALEKILTLPLEFYDENNPGRIPLESQKGFQTLPGPILKPRGFVA